MAQHLCVWGKPAWQWQWEIEFPAHLGGSCSAAFLARLAEPSRAGTGGHCAHFLLLSWELASWWRLECEGGGQPPPVPTASVCVYGPSCKVLLQHLWAWHSSQGSWISAQVLLLFGQVIHVSEPRLPHL